MGPDTDWSEALTGVDVVVHLAARVHVMKDTAADSFAEFHKVNLAGSQHLAQQAVIAGVRRLIFISSIKVNGEATQERPFSETDTPDPQDPYAISKWGAEQALQQIAAETGLEVVIIRPPLIYGPGVKGNFLRLLKLIDKGIPLPLGSVDNRRSLLALDNLVDLLIRCIDHPAAAGQTFLAADGEDLSTPELLRRLADAMDRPARLVPVPPALLRLGGRLTGRVAEVERLIGSLQVDIRHTHETLDWTPPVSIDEALGKTARYFLKSQSQ